MTTPRLSILIAAHNCGEYLTGTLDSIVASLGDALSRTEIVIINDDSTDRTQAIIDNYALQIASLRHFHTRYRNVGKVRNYAVQQSRGDYILMVDGDDRLLPGALRERLNTLDLHKPDILLSKIIEVRPESPQPQWLPGKFTELSRHNAIERFLIHRDFQAHFIGQFFIRALLQQNPFPDFICYEDTWLFPLLLTKSNKTLFTYGGFYLYYKHPNSLSTRIDAPKIACLIAATENMDKVLPAQFEHLITCHWLNIANRHHAVLRGTSQGSQVRERIARVSLTRFLLNGKIRTSYKRKMLTVRKRDL
ncbi:glycosyltransferase [Erwinia tracheiphila]|uniref:Glucosyltransferase n=1 Tax=Erwinia tracheiphila TaxID=65700 RepID=A0A0M2KHW2_9GAMM|nr:glycosyltransferase family 2 protein [Erwinia tracheiphila]AXF78179.1 glycosyltransferase family 2 protein [Erwinia tracheiphila]EOS94628.1 glucosyltransferase [Erwinia tracheiphila PSU-1]KKF36902.1 glucosyltransferase [Erwinia tracheiphila]UIA83101.1 glycosyltransferase [Erwinia tracheiphila]UIA88244.1 glycosyltransferase [Erwinia tracheiphila]